MLSKTDFLLYLEAPMHLWAKSHQKLPAKPPSPFEIFLSQQGQTIEALAKPYIEEIVLPGYGDGQLLWQQSFDDGRFQIRTDALIFDRNTQAYDLYEIKSSTSVQTNHKYDLAFQALLLAAKINLERVFIIHVQKNYCLTGEFDQRQFFTTVDLTAKLVNYHQEVAKLREDAYQVTQLTAPRPDFACTKPQTCPCPSLCHPNLPDHPIYELPYIGKKALTLRQMGIIAIKDIPESFNLNEVQRKITQAVQNNAPIIDRDTIRHTLSQLEYPLHFLDYETFNPAIPLFKNYHPYESIVFQYSLFVLDSPDLEPQHFDCLDTGDEDPAIRIVPDLLSHIKPAGSVVVWNQSFEATRNQELANRCPQYADQLRDINSRLFDLMKIFKDGHYIHPDFHGSASLKAVLPVLCPELSYDSLSIVDGGQAMITWHQLQSGSVPPEAREEIEIALKAYCQMDTWGLVELWRKLQKI